MPQVTHLYILCSSLVKDVAMINEFAEISSKRRGEKGFCDALATVGVRKFDMEQKR